MLGKWCPRISMLGHPKFRHDKTPRLFPLAAWVFGWHSLAQDGPRLWAIPFFWATFLLVWDQQTPHQIGGSTTWTTWEHLLNFISKGWRISLGTPWKKQQQGFEVLLLLKIPQEIMGWAADFGSLVGTPKLESQNAMRNTTWFFNSSRQQGNSVKWWRQSHQHWKAGVSTDDVYIYILYNMYIYIYYIYIIYRYHHFSKTHIFQDSTLFCAAWCAKWLIAKWFQEKNSQICPKLLVLNLHPWAGVFHFTRSFRRSWFRLSPYIIYIYIHVYCKHMYVLYIWIDQQVQWTRGLNIQSLIYCFFKACSLL